MSLYILIISPDIIGPKMAGPGIRYYEMARILSREYPVILAIPNDDFKYFSSSGRITFCAQDRRNLLQVYNSCRVVICQGNVTKRFPFLLTGPKPLVIDLYDLIHLEILAQDYLLQQNSKAYDLVLDFILHQLQYGDFFICASERQRDFWLGMLNAVKRINPLTYEQDATLRNLIDTVPFGVPAQAPVLTKRVLKGVYPEIHRSDKIILWAGGIWDWLDPFTPIKAMSIILKKRKDVKLFFMGTRRPFLDKSGLTPTTLQAINLSRELHLFDQYVFFNKGWVPYHERQNYLLDADIGITTYRNTLETHFSWRTRILDYLWAGVPVICSGGDSLSELIAAKELGMLFTGSCEHELAGMILSLLENNQLKKFQKNILKIQKELSWEKALTPLLKFCHSPQKTSG